MPPLLLAPLQPLPHHVDYGLLLVVAALFLASGLAHRYWRAKIRLEDQLEARDLDLQRALERYRLAFRAMPHPAAFVDRNTGLVMEATPGWPPELPEVGDLIYQADPAAQAAWNAIPPPDSEHRAAPPVDLSIRDLRLRAEPLHGPSLGVVLVVKP